MARDPTGTAVYDPENPLTRTWTGKTPRPSPRTGSTGAGVQKFGTQQLKYLNTSQPALGVHEMDVGARTRIFGLFPSLGTQAVYTGGSTPFSQKYQQERIGTVRTVEQLETSDRVIPEGWGGIQFPDLTTLFPPASPNGNGEEKCHLDDDKPFCGFTELMGGEVCECPNWFSKETTDPTAGGRGCECEACKNGTGQCDASVPQCDAWDLGCIATGGKVEETFNWIKIILIVIGIGILLWLLRPLFGVAKNITNGRSNIEKLGSMG